MSLLYDKVLRAMVSRKLSRAEERIIKLLVKAQVFDATNIACDQKDPQRTLHSVEDSVPIRPPYRDTWIEWPQELLGEDGEPSVRSICGMMISHARRDAVTTDAVRKAIDSAREDGFNVDSTDVFEGNSEEFCLYVAFLDVKESSVSSVPLGLCFDGMGKFDLSHDGTKIESLSHSHSDDNFNKTFWPHIQRAKIKYDSSEFYPVTIPLIAMEVLQLLNCKNVEQTEHFPPHKLQKSTLKRGHPPLCIYKTLSINIPGTLSESHDGTQSTGDKNRFHLVRGHFKNLKHDRFVNKGWHWWPSHARGNPSLGLVEKDYKLTSAAIMSNLTPCR